MGFFDSGIGGTCILNAFRKLCPEEETVYIADSENCPYGNKPAEEIIRLSEANVKKLLKAGADKIVLGCTHFPHLKPVIERVCAGRAEVIDLSDAVARQAKRVLEERGLF